MAQVSKLDSNPDLAKDIARIYCTNGRNKTQALIEAGYSESYAKTSKGLSIYRKKPVIDAINKYEAQIQANSPYTAERAEQELDEALTLAREQKHITGMVQAITGKCKLYALMTDKVQTEDITSPDIDDEESDIMMEAVRKAKINLAAS